MNNKSKRLILTLPKELYDKAKQNSEKQYKSVSAFIRDCIFFELEKRKFKN